MKVKNICEINLHFPINNGVEGYIYRVDIDNKKQIYKEFITGTSLVVLNRKQKKLAILDANVELDQYFPKVNWIVMSILNEYMRGYLMEEIVGINPTQNNLTLCDKLTFLKQLRAILEQLIKDDIFYFDIRTPNIIIKEDKNIVLLDKDNVKTKEHNLDKIPTELKAYLINGGELDENAIIAMFNIFTKKILENEPLFFEKEGMKMISFLEERKPNTIFDHEYLFEYIKKS